MFMSRPGDTTRSGSTKSRTALVADEAEAETKRLCKCSFDKFAIIGTLATIALVGFLVVGLDISISQSKLVHYNAFVNGTYRLHGTPEEYAVFYRLDYSDALLIDRVDMNYVQFNIIDFFLTFRYTTIPTFIKLSNMRFMGKVSQRLAKEFSQENYGFVNPEFIVEFNQSIGPFTNFQLDQCDKCVLNASDPDNLSQFQHIECLKSVFLVRQSMTFLYPNVGDGRLKVKVFGWNFLHLDEKSRSLTSMHKNSEQILIEAYKMPLNLKELHLRDCEVNLTTISRFQSSLTNLTLDNVNITGGTSRLSEIFSKFLRLEELTLKFGYWQELDKVNSYTFKKLHNVISKVGIQNRNSYTVDLIDLPSSLRVLRLSNVILSAQNYKQPVTSLHLNLSLLVVHGTVFENQESWDMAQDSSFIRYDQFAWQNLNTMVVKNEYPEFLHIPILQYSSLKIKKNIFLDEVVGQALTFQRGENLDIVTESEEALKEDMVGSLTGIGASSPVVLPSVLMIQLHDEASQLMNPARSVDVDVEEKIRFKWFTFLNTEIFLDRKWIATSKW